MKEGDRVIAGIDMSCSTWFYCIHAEKLLCDSFTQLSIHTNGTFAEYVKVPAAQVHILPEKLSFEEGAFIKSISCVIHAAKALDARLGSSGNHWLIRSCLYSSAKAARLRSTSALPVMTALSCSTSKTRSAVVLITYTKPIYWSRFARKKEDLKQPKRELGNFWHSKTSLFNKLADL